MFTTFNKAYLSRVLMYFCSLHRRKLVTPGYMCNWRYHHVYSVVCIYYARFFYFPWSLICEDRVYESLWGGVPWRL